MPPNHDKLDPYFHEPDTFNEVMAHLRAVGGPQFGYEVAQAIGATAAITDRALRRLHAKGKLTRYKMPAQRHSYHRRTKSVVPGGATRNLWLYSIAEGGE